MIGVSRLRSPVTNSPECQATMLRTYNDHIPQQRQSSGDFSLPEPERFSTNSITLIGKIAGSVVEMTYEEPDTVLHPEPILLSPGYCGIKSAYGNLRHYLAERGTPAISYRPPRTQENFAWLHPTHLKDVERLQAQAAYSVMREVKQAVGFEKFIISGHSMGGRTGVRTALEHPEYIDSLLLVGSAGLHGHHTLGEMMLRGGRVIKNEIVPGLPKLAENSSRSAGADALYYIFRDPVRTLREGVAVASCDSREDLTKIRNMGIGIGALLFGRDGFFEQDDIMKHSGNLLDVVRVIEDANHIEPQLNPEKNAAIQLEIVCALHATALRAA